jgi:addiction module HigA family antidote
MADDPPVRFDPDYVVHPGRVIAEALAEQGMTQHTLAQRTGYTQKYISQVVGTCIVPLTAEAAVRIGNVLGISPRLLARMQADYDVGMIEGKVGSG